MTARPLVFALGEPGYDLVSEPRLDSIQQHMGEARNPRDTSHLLDYLAANPWEAASITWTLQIDQTPIYAILPSGPFAAETYSRLREFLAQRAAGKVERISIPGRVSGRTTLLDGHVVPTIEPEPRGMYSWTTKALIDAVAGAPPAANARAAHREHYDAKVSGVRGFLDKVYYELRNLGVTAEERAINYAATNALLLGNIYDTAIKDALELDAIEVERSGICRPDSECWDVKLLFFYPQSQIQTVRRVYRFTVDVSDVVPVMVGPVRNWSVR
jgi:cyanobactin maturation PatA/PatG family protease